MTETKRCANSQVVRLVFAPDSQELTADAATATVLVNCSLFLLGK